MYPLTSKLDRPFPTRSWGLVALLVAAPTACSGPELFVENDALGLGSPSDRHYTSGIRYQNTIRREDAPEFIRNVVGALRPFKDEDPTEIGFVVGQHIYTPADIEVEALIELDRPYAGWLYGGVVRIDTDFEPDGHGSDDQTTTELIVGVIGPESFAEEVQSGIHEVIGSEDPKGWEHQLDTEVTLLVSIQRQTRTLRGTLGHMGVDLISKGSGTIGTPYTGAEVGMTGRLGWNLPRDFGVSVSEPVLAETAASRIEDDPRSFYLFAGAAGRGVALNTFLDGNTWKDSHEVNKRPLVADLSLGFALQLGSFRLTFSWVYRTKEFYRQEDESIFGSVSLSWT